MVPFDNVTDPYILIRASSIVGLLSNSRYRSRHSKNFSNPVFILLILGIHETEIKMVKSKWSYKKFMVEIRNRNELRGSGSKRITRVKTDYEGRNELRGSKQITRVETNYEGRNELRGSK